MRRELIHILLMMLVAVLLPAACVTGDDGYPEEDGATYLTVYVYNANQPATTRADVSYVSATDAESKVHTLQMWIFEHGGDSDGQLVAYHETETSAMSATNTSEQYQLLVSEDFATRKPDVDVYVVANAATYSSETLTNTTTRAQLDAALLSGFGTTALVQSVPTTGLPMSGVLKGLHILGDKPTLMVGKPGTTTTAEATAQNMASVQLVRAVSKLRFVFCYPSDMPGVEISAITLDREVIPSEEYLFLEGDYNEALNGTDTYKLHVNSTAGYAPATATPLISAAVQSTTAYKTIATYDDTRESPTDYAYSTTKTYSPNYEAYVDGLISDGKLTQMGLTYLRESDRQLSGTISWKRQNDDRTWPATPTVSHFTMLLPGDFSRNHTWTVYAYFTSTGLYVKPIAMPWQWGGEMTIMSKTTVQLNINNTFNLYGNEQHFNYLMYSPDEDGNGTPDYNNWENNYCAIAYGYDGSRPRFAPWLELRTTSMEMLRLETDNTEFGFVLYDSEEGTYSSVLDELEIPAGKNVLTHFYVVPKENLNLSNPPNRIVNVMLIEQVTTFADNTMPEVSVNRLPWNSELPGAESHETAQFYWVTANEYSQNVEGTVETLRKQ